VAHEISVEVTFSAAHRITLGEGEVDRLHGHNWRTVVTVRADHLDENGLALDFGLLRRITREVTQKLDHQDVNAGPPFDRLNPTAENVARWIFEEIDSRLAEPHLRVQRVRVWEEEGVSASYCA
jgi:6-pyruvoyltetrahydropterin/6-carboxytetrahydropterin synthase